MVDMARENRAQTAASQQNLLAESYYGLRLAQQVVAVREETYKGLQKHYENALKLEAAGMIDKAGRLFAQVNMDEAKRALEAARKEETVVQSALKVLLNKKDTDENIVPTSPLFMNDSLPPKMLFDMSVNSGNYMLNQLQLQEHIAKQEVRIAQSGYLPNIALLENRPSIRMAFKAIYCRVPWWESALHGISLTDWIGRRRSGNQN